MNKKRLSMHVKKGDVVAVIAGDEAASGKTGKVLKVIPETQRAIVEGLNLVKKHMRKTQNNPEGGIIEKESPIAVSNLRVVEAANERPARNKA